MASTPRASPCLPLPVGLEADVLWPAASPRPAAPQCSKVGGLAAKSVRPHLPASQPASQPALESYPAVLPARTGAQRRAAADAHRHHSHRQAQLPRQSGGVVRPRQHAVGARCAKQGKGRRCVAVGAVVRVCQRAQLKLPVKGQLARPGRAAAAAWHQDEGLAAQAVAHLQRRVPGKNLALAAGVRRAARGMLPVPHAQRAKGRHAWCICMA